MKIHTSDFKSGIKLMGRELSSKITYMLNEEEIELTSEDLNSITPHYESSILKSAMKQLDIDSNVLIPEGTVINYQFGLKIGNSYEYLDYGNYIVYKVEEQKDTHSYTITCYDKMLYSMIPYESMNITYPISIRDYLEAICDKLNLDFANSEDTFANYDKMIQNELYLDSNGNSLDYTFRDVLDELAQVTASTICINEETDELEIRYINDTEDTIDEEYLKDVNVEFGKKYGPINSIVLSRSAESDNVYLKDIESVDANGLCEIKIKDNQIMNFNDRSEFLNDILDKLDGLEYYINDFSSTGIFYYNLCDKYNVSIGENIYSCIMFNDEANITQGAEESTYTEMPEESETDYSKADKTDRKATYAYAIVNKQTAEIELLSRKVSSVEDLAGNVYTKEETNVLINEAKSGLTNTYTQVGGGNILRNTGLWFEQNDINNPYEYWIGLAEKNSNNNATSKTSIILQNGDFEQQQIVVNDKYTISFKYRKIVPLATATVVINGKTYNLDSENFIEFYTGKKDDDGNYIIDPIEVTSNQIDIKFSCDTDDAVEIYDLMCNRGEVKAVWVQNENETTTDTVNISQGITIISNVKNTKFKADADGVRIFDKNDTTNSNPITEFTDKGMTTKEAIVENQATIVGILRQKVGDQVWDCLII